MGKNGKFGSLILRIPYWLTVPVLNVSLYGCDIGGGIVLKEESKDAYGSGILFKINGFANKNLEYSIVNTDGKDYSGNVNLIN